MGSIFKKLESLNGGMRMSKVKDFREALDARLEALDARADALEAQFEATREETHRRIDLQKEHLGDAADQLQKIAAASPRLATEVSQHLRASVEHLRVQLALGQAETRDLFHEQKKNIHDAIVRIESSFDSAEEGLEDDLAKETATFIRVANRLRAELEAAELQFALFRAEHRDEFKSGKEALRKGLDELRIRIGEAGHEAGEQFEKFETEAVAGLSKIRKALGNLGKDG
jgi:hypothetical protein